LLNKQFYKHKEKAPKIMRKTIFKITIKTGDNYLNNYLKW